MERDPKKAIELLTWIQKAIPKTFPFLLKDENDYVKVYPLNRFLAPHGITSYHLRKIGADHASRVHGGKNDSCRQRYRDLATRHKKGYRATARHYGVMNDRPIIPAPRPTTPMIKKEYNEIEDIISLYGEISDDDN
ncbi:6542_t:CDS:1 [Acaulospora morrowiae]|uniref:6542_t:CDS:1 n=1 Tax=Acaulospora morrowiae TaxID=94023 RepID=A0A9N9J6R2_9GLOM|nr:6542_t:CDS:1 [Acaulospora morrowiae]